MGSKRKKVLESTPRMDKRREIVSEREAPMGEGGGKQEYSARTSYMGLKG